MCIQGADPKVYSNCIDLASKAMIEKCPNQTEGLAWPENVILCMVRYSNRSFFGSLELEPSYVLYNSGAIRSNLTEFNKLWEDLTSRVIDGATSSSSQGKYYAAEKVPLTPIQNVYALMQCTSILSLRDCNICLKQSVRDYESCCRGYQGGIVFRPSQGSESISAGIVVAIVGNYLLSTICYNNLCLQEEKVIRPSYCSPSCNREKRNRSSRQGGFGEVYKAVLNGTEVAVKRLSKASGQGARDFKNEAVLVAKLQHRNLVRLLGFCVEGEEKTLVYEFVPNKSLDYFLFESSKHGQVDWKTRYKIVQGIARGVLYLHQESRLTIIHSDLEGSNILLDADTNPKIADFGMARIMGMDQTQSDTSRIVGTYGYMAPEYALHGHFSMKSDVYSFGVIVLEIISVYSTMDGDDPEVPNTEHQLPSQRSVRQKHDPAWAHVSQTLDSNGKSTLTCDFCKKKNQGGGINRMKQHLAGVKGNTNACKNVPPEVQHAMRMSLKENDDRAKEKSGVNNTRQFVDLEDDEDSGQGFMPPRQKRKANTDINSYFKQGLQDQSQPTIKSCLQSKEKIHDADMAVALFFYDVCMPMNAVNSRFYQPMISKRAFVSCSIRVGLLRDAKLQVSLIIESFRSTWAETGCTLMADGWKDTRQRPLINFLVYCPKGITFIKSVDASGIYTTAENLCNLFAEVVDMIGPQNVVHMVTDSAPNYKAAGGKLTERYPTIYWSPCAAHCINLILEDVGELPLVKKLTSYASKITIFVYNHKNILNWLRNRPGWREIIRPAETRFATSFIALQSLYAHKDYLQSMVVDEEFRKISRSEKAKLVKQLIFDDDFWKECFVVVQIMALLIRLLRICDSDEKPSLPYVYEGMYRARLGVKKIFKKEKRLYKPYTRIIDSRWDKMLRRDIYAAAYFLNPAFLEREGSFSREIALTCSKTTRPDEWWKLFGFDIPDLQKLAIRILSQTASSSGCERNWSVFERIHTKKRNRLEHQRLNDLVFVHYNLRLQDRSKKNRSYDPVDYESIDKTEFWIVEEEEEGELDLAELEDKLLEEYPKDDDEPTPGVEDLDKEDWML
ncbi:unnamed protein product [Microthlaspi erraticum]|uniref:Protein kinase domain-containing protein n=1 Tax=Microthlaspi erraticum TaxID=1685480 RepID=A0A6D2LG99_9BRAS|nr:unnamed protein product [Microthlaspi erraticum]